MNNTTFVTVNTFDESAIVCESFAVAIYILASLGMAGNVVTFIAIHTKGTKHSTNILLKWICIIDSCTLLAAAFFNYLHIFASYRISRVIYPVLLLLLMSLQFMSAWSVVLLGYQRYRAVCYPFSVFRGYSTKKQKIRLLIVSLLAILVSVPPGIHAVYQYWLEVPDGHIIFVILFNGMYNGFLLFMAPALPLSYFMIRISCVLQSNNHEQADAVRAQQDSDNQSVTRLTGAIIVMFLISHSGHFIWSIMTVWAYYKPFTSAIWRINRKAWCIISVIVCFNASSNLFINYIFRESFRKSINESSQCKKCWLLCNRRRIAKNPQVGLPDYGHSL